MKMNRRYFIQQSAGLAAMAGMGLSWQMRTASMKLSFSTLGCPEWDFDRIIGFANQKGFQGVEFRGILKEMELYNCPEFNNKDHIQISRRKMEDKNLSIVCLGSSVVLHENVGPKRVEEIDKAKKYIDLAVSLNAKAIRVFPDKFLSKTEKKISIQNMIETFNSITEHAKGTEVNILMETHGELLQSNDILTVIENVSGKNAGLVWDMANMWSKTREPVGEMYQRLKPFIKHTHIKDVILQDAVVKDVLIGKGESPVFEAVDLLRKDEYAGFFSFEWEKRWHPELAEPELAITDYVDVMRKRYSK